MDREDDRVDSDVPDPNDDRDVRDRDRLDPFLRPVDLIPVILYVVAILFMMGWALVALFGTEQ